MPASGFRLCCVVLTLVAVILPASQAPGMTEQELCQLYLGVVEEAVDVFEPLWTDDSARVPNSGFFDLRKYTNWGIVGYPEVVTVCGNGQIIYCYGLLLSEADKETFGQAKLSRATLLDRCIKVLRWISLTSAYVDKPYDYLPMRSHEQIYKGKNWFRPLGRRADIMGWPTLAAARLWDKLDAETKGLLEKVMIGGAPKERLPFTWNQSTGGNHDQVKQDLGSSFGAAFLFPQRPDHRLSMDIVRWQGIDMVSTWHDRANATVADGKKISEYAKVWNLYQDYSSDHHGWSQVWYGNDKLFEGRFYLEIASRLTKLPVPETFRYAGNGFDGILDWTKTLCLPEGEPMPVHGMEYDSYYGSGLLSYCYGAVLKKDPVAAALEERAAKVLDRHIRTVRQYDYHRNSFAKAATAYLIHKMAGPRVEPVPFAEAFRRLEGTYHYKWQQALVHRAPNKWVSFSWGSITGGRLSRMCGQVVPARGLAEGLEPLVYIHPTSLIGIKTVKWEGKAPAARLSEEQYRFSRDDGSLSTAGVVDEAGMDRAYAFFSFDDGPCALLTEWRAKQACTLSFTGMPVFFYARDGITKGRTYYDAQGSQALEQSAERRSSWWCVNDMLGVTGVQPGEVASPITIKRQPGYNWARTDAYKDKCDTVYLGGIENRKVEAGGIGLDLSAVFYPDTPHGQIAKASEVLSKSGTALRLPDGWKGLVVPDAVTPAKRYLALANLSRGSHSAAVEVSFEEGAPILTAGTIVTGKTGMAFMSLSGWESCGQTLELYVEAMENKRVRGVRQTQGRYLLDPVGDQKVGLRICYTGKGAERFVLSTPASNAVKAIPLSALEDGRSFVVELDQPMLLEIQGKGYEDRTSPAVEIGDVESREDGRVTVEVTAQDRSGIASVELYCDGKSLGKQAAGPYVWIHRPGNGAHTFHAVATDASGSKNTRTSFKRTIMVEVGKPSP